MAYYKRDKSGQWWYLWGRENQNRQRAYLYTCDECGKDFPRKKYSKKSSRIFCGKSCSGKAQSKDGINCTAKGEHSPHWRGGIRKRRKYISIYTPNHPYASDGYVMEHRLIMEQCIGRFLLPNEHVHHLDGNPTNNHISNLKLMSHSQHSSHHNHQRKRDGKGRFLS
jgi:hypothetical protein